MKIKLLGTGAFAASEIAGYALPPAWRKATRNMIMATVSVERALARTPEWRADETGLVVASNSGELDTSADFLTTLAQMKLARPLLFQNSLHNATTGFVAIHFRLTGPTVSVSSGLVTPREALETARSMIDGGICRACLVTLVEGHLRLAGMIERPVAEGAATVLLANEDYAADVGRAAAPEFIFENWSADYPRNEDLAPLVAADSSQFYKNATSD